MAGDSAGPAGGVRATPRNKGQDLGKPLGNAQIVKTEKETKGLKTDRCRDGTAKQGKASSEIFGDENPEI